MAPPFKPVPASIVRDYLAGATIDEIAFAAGTNYARIRRGLLRRGVDLRPRGARLCVNPAHLEAVTQTENNRRMRESLAWAA